MSAMWGERTFALFARRSACRRAVSKHSVVSCRDMRPDDVPLVIGLGLIAAMGFVTAIVGRPIYRLMAHISKRNILINRAQIEWMQSPRVIWVTRVLFLIGSIWMAYEAIKIAVGEG